MLRKKSLITILSLIFMICTVCLLFTSGVFSSNAASYNMEVVSGSLATKYLDHWSSGQGSRVSGESYGKWYFGYGDLISETNSYSFTQASFDGSVESKPYTTGSSHQMHWRFNVSTRSYSSNSTQTMFVWESEVKGSVKFSGLFSKATSDKQVLGGTQNNVDTLWLAGINWKETAFNWVDGASYTCGMFKVDGESGRVSTITYKNYDAEYVWLVPQDAINVNAGDKIVFGLKCNNPGNNVDEYSTNTLGFFTSKFTPSTYNVTVNNNGEMGAVSGIATSTNVELGTVYNVSVIPSAGYQIKSIYWGNNKLSVADRFNFSGQVTVGGDTELAVEYESAEYNVTVTNDYQKGSVSGVANGINYNSGSLLDVTVKAKTGYEISSINFGGENVTVTDKYQVNFKKTITSNTALMVEYLQKNYTLTLDYNGSLGTITGVTSGTQYASGQNQSFTISANENAKITAIKYAEEDIAVENGKTVAITKKLTKDTTLKVTFENENASLGNYSVNITNDSEKGTVTGVESKTYQESTVLLITVKAKENYKIKSVKWNGAEITELSNEESVSFVRSVMGDSSLVIEYESTVTTALITITNNQNQGLVNGVNGQMEYVIGQAKEITVTALKGYKISSVVYNGANISVTNALSFTFSAEIQSSNTLIITYITK